MEIDVQVIWPSTQGNTGSCEQINVGFAERTRADTNQAQPREHGTARSRMSILSSLTEFKSFPSTTQEPQRWFNQLKVRFGSVSDTQVRDRDTDVNLRPP